MPKQAEKSLIITAKDPKASYSLHFQWPAVTLIHTKRCLDVLKKIAAIETGLKERLGAFVPQRQQREMLYRNPEWKRLSQSPCFDARRELNEKPLAGFAEVGPMSRLHSLIHDKIEDNQHRHYMPIVFDNSTDPVELLCDQDNLASPIQAICDSRSTQSESIAQYWQSEPVEAFWVSFPEVAQEVTRITDFKSIYQDYDLNRFCGQHLDMPACMELYESYTQSMVLLFTALVLIGGTVAFYCLRSACQEGADSNTLRQGSLYLKQEKSARLGVAHSPSAISG